MTARDKKPSLIGRLFSRKPETATPDAPPETETEERPSADETAVEPPPGLASETEEPETLPADNDAQTGQAASDTPENEKTSQDKGGWFARLRAGLAKSSSRLGQGITSIFTRRKLDDDTLQELEDILIQADLGVETATRITDALAAERYDKTISPEEVRAVLAQEVEKVLTPVAKPLEIDPTHNPHVILVVGVNGTGKTTTIGKLASRFAAEGHKVMLVAGDTFRAAAIDQLKIWGERTGAPVVAREVGADAAGLVFDALTQARKEGRDVLLVDTAGRLQNKAHLMAELEKVIRVMRKIDPTAPHSVLLVLDATTGQNALAQVEAFRNVAGVTGIIMTKLDGTARGGILVAIAAKYGLPVHAIGVGEGVEDLQPFVPAEFAAAIAAG